MIGIDALVLDRRFSSLLTIALCLLLSASAPATPAVTGSPLSLPLSPHSLQELRTTNPTIALDNLDGSIEVLERTVASSPANDRRLGELAELLLTRGQATTSIADYERADSAAERFVQARPADADAYLTRAKTRATFHRFAAALADLDAATRLNGHAARIAAVRASVLQATGHLDEALALRHEAAALHPTILTLGAEATVLAERGDIGSAEAVFVAAQNSYRDVSPIPLCWLYFQQGLMWQRAGDLPRATELFTAAHDRLPRNAMVADHLGWLLASQGDSAQAIAMLQTAAESSDDPAAAADLARVLQYAGDQTHAAAWRARAAARYEELLQQHPAAFAQHAALFWLGAGANPQRALALANQDVATRAIPSSYAVLLQAALANAQADEACRAAAGVLRFGHPTPQETALGERAVAEHILKSCPVRSSSG